MKKRERRQRSAALPSYKEQARLQRRRSNVVSFFLIVSLIALIPEINPLDNTIGGVSLFWKAFLYGSVAMVLLLELLRHFHKGELFRSFSPPFYFGLAITSGFLFAAVSSSLNRHLGATLTEVKAYQVMSKSTDSKGKIPWLFLSIAGSEERIIVERPLWNSVAEGSTVFVTTRTGLLGFDFVEEVNR